ncbi:MAG: non-ribosomal peptide synthetase, partial [Candidatus Aminicenantes bacterium]
MKKMNKAGSKNVEDIIALTPMQQGMLFLYLKDPGSGKNLEQLYLEISGKIDIALFRKAWDFVIHSNEMLRTVFRWEKVKEPVQIILKEHHLNLEYFDFSSRNRDEKKKLLKDLRDRDRNEKFDLREVAFRVRLCKIEEEKYAMLVSNHHILYDGWSNGIILKEFFNAYNDLRHHRVPVKPGKGRLKDFICWIQSQDTDDIKQKREKFWKEYLEGFEVKHRHGGFAKRREEVRSVGEYRFKFHAAIKRDIESFVREHKISLSSLVYFAWGLLLQGYNDCRDILFDTTVSGRSAKVENIENMVGLFINTLPLRVKAFPGEKVIDVLQRISRMLRQREEFENVSPVFLKEYLRWYRGDVLFDSLVVIENYPLDIRSIQETSEFSFGSFSSVGMTDYDLTVILTIFDRIEVNFIFNKRLLSRVVVEEMSHLFIGVVKNIISDGGKRVGEIGVLPKGIQLREVANQKFLQGGPGGTVFSKRV